MDADNLEEFSFGDPKPEPRQKKEGKGIDMSGNKNYKCKICKETYSMPKWLYSQRSTSPMGINKTCQNKECEVEAMTKKALEKREEQQREKRKEHKKWKEETEKSIRTREDWKGILQNEINWMIKQFDKYNECISRPWEGTLRWDAGHYYSRSSCMWLSFHLHNIHKQGSNPNQYRHGDFANYQLGLKKRYGTEYVQMLEDEKLLYRGFELHFTIPNLEIWTKRARAIKKKMKAGEHYDREKAMKELDIYKPDWKE